MIYLLIGILFVLCVVDVWKNKKIFSPSFIFNIIWFVTLSLYQFKLSYIQQDLSNKTIFIFYVCVLSYNITLTILNFIALNRKDKETNNSKMPKKIFVFARELKSKIFNIMTSKTVAEKVKIAKYIAIIIFIIEVICSKGVPLIWKIIGNGKTYFDFGISSLHGAFCGLIICLGAYSLFTKSKDKFIYLAMGILIISRQILISMILEAIVFEIYSNKKNLKKSIIKISVILIIGIIGFTLLGNFRSGSNVMHDVFQAKEQYKDLQSTLKWIYSYMTFSISNFNNLVEMTPGAINYGTSMLTELLPTVIMNLINLEEIHTFNHLVSLNYTVSTYLPNIYLDAGIVGIAIFNMILAFIGYKSYINMKNEETSKNILLYSIFVHNIIFLFFTNMFFYLPIIVQYIYIWIIFSEKKELKNESK